MKGRIHGRVARSISVAVLCIQIIFFAALPFVAFGMSGMKDLSSVQSVEESSESTKLDMSHVIIGGLKGIIRPDNGHGDASDTMTEAVMASALKKTYSKEDFLSAQYVNEKYASALTAMADEDVRVADVLAQADEYPVEFLEMLAKYPETVTFVSDYLHSRYNQPAGSVGEVKEGKIPLLIQWDKRWGYASYGDSYIAYAGCGPTSLSMVIVGLTGDITVTPKVVADYAVENGYYVSGTGSTWSLMSEGGEYFGVKASELTLDRELIMTMLKEGKPIVCSVGAGDFTTEGHFIVLTGVSDDEICINDPNSCVNSGQLWSYERLAPQIRNLWVFSLLDG